MTTMKSVPTGGPGKIEVAEIERPVPGPRDLLVRPAPAAAAAPTRPSCRWVACHGARMGTAPRQATGRYPGRSPQSSQPALPRRIFWR